MHPVVHTLLLAAAVASYADSTVAGARAAAVGLKTTNATTNAIAVPAKAAVCRLHLEGYRNRTGFKRAELICTGGSITAAAHPVLLQALQKQYNRTAPRGVVWAKGDDREGACNAYVRRLNAVCWQSATAMPDSSAQRSWTSCHHSRVNTRVRKCLFQEKGWFQELLSASWGAATSLWTMAPLRTTQACVCFALQPAVTFLALTAAQLCVSLAVNLKATSSIQRAPSGHMGALYLLKGLPLLRYRPARSPGTQPLPVVRSVQTPSQHC